MSTNQTTSRSQSIAHVMMAACLGVIAVAVFFNVVLRYGFGSGIAASEELSRLLLCGWCSLAPLQLIQRVSTWPSPASWPVYAITPKRSKL